PSHPLHLFLPATRPPETRRPSSCTPQDFAQFRARLQVAPISPSRLRLRRNSNFRNHLTERIRLVLLCLVLRVISAESKHILLPHFSKVTALAPLLQCV